MPASDCKLEGHQTNWNPSWNPAYKDREAFSATSHFEKEQTFVHQHLQRHDKVHWSQERRRSHHSTSSEGDNNGWTNLLYINCVTLQKVVRILSTSSTTSTPHAPNSLRWVIAGLAYTLDTTRVNAKTDYCLAKNIDHKKRNLSFNFGWELALQWELNGLSKLVQLKRRILLGEPLEKPARVTNPTAPEKRTRCDQQHQKLCCWSNNKTGTSKLEVDPLWKKK